MIALLQRFPSLRYHPDSKPVLPQGLAARHPELADDVRVVEEVVADLYRDKDTQALQLQNAHRRRNVIVLIGSSLLTGLGGLQTAFADQAWPGLVLGVFATVVAGLGRTDREKGTVGRYLGVRLQAERLRGLHFRYLARTAPFSTTDGAERRRALERAVIQIARGEEPS